MAAATQALARASAVALNNMGIELLALNAWREAAETLHDAVFLLQRSVSDDDNHVVDCDSFVDKAEKRILCRSQQQLLASPQHRQAAPHASRGAIHNDIFPVFIHKTEGRHFTHDMPMNVQSSMILYNYALVLRCAGAEDDAVYRMLQLSSRLLLSAEYQLGHDYHSFQVHLIQQQLYTSQRLGLPGDCNKHGEALDSLLRLAVEYNRLVENPSAPAA